MTQYKGYTINIHHDEESMNPLTDCDGQPLVIVADVTEDNLKATVECYADWCFGDVYGYVISNEENDHIDSCYGFIGDDHDKSGLMEYAKNAIDCIK